MFVLNRLHGSMCTVKPWNNVDNIYLFFVSKTTILVVSFSWFDYSSTFVQRILHSTHIFEMADLILSSKDNIDQR